MSVPDADARDCADMQRLAAGHDAALNDLMDRHAARVFQFLHRLLGNEDDARDLAQDTFVRVYRYRKNYRSGERFSTWLYTIAANLARNLIRWRSHRPHVSLDADHEATGQSLNDLLPGPDAAPSEELAAAERASAVRAAVGRLPADLREAIVLCEWEDHSVAEAATILRSTPKAVESRLYRARKLLRERLKKWL